MWKWIAYMLPRKLVHWAVVRMFAEATMGQYGDTEVSALTMMEAMRRWDCVGIDFDHLDQVREEWMQRYLRR